MITCRQPGETLQFQGSESRICAVFHILLTTAYDVHMRIAAVPTPETANCAHVDLDSAQVHSTGATGRANSVTKDPPRRLHIHKAVASGELY